jgi:hypothetical protein
MTNLIFGTQESTGVLKLVSDNALVALTRMIALGKREEKETSIKVSVNLISKRINK